MLLYTLQVMDLLDDPQVSGEKVRDWLTQFGLFDIEVKRIAGPEGATQFIRVFIPSSQRTGPTLGIIGSLGGLGSRPNRIGLVSDADGAIVALACAAKLGKMAKQGDRLPGDVIITTHICPNAPIVPHHPQPFMGYPVAMEEMNRFEVDAAMEAILSVDATKGNWILNRRGFAISPTVKEGYILRVSEDLLRIMPFVTGEPPAVLPITTQDITPYANGLYHLNSIMQPSTATTAPVVGVAVTAAVPVAGSATGANQAVDLEMAGRFCIEVAKSFTGGACAFFDEEEYERIIRLYGSMKHLQKPSRT